MCRWLIASLLVDSTLLLEVLSGNACSCTDGSCGATQGSDGHTSEGQALLQTKASSLSHRRKTSSWSPFGSSRGANHLSGRGCKPMNYTALDQFLKDFVSPPTTKDGINTTLFDYQTALSCEESLTDLNEFVASLDSVDTTCFSHDAALAFWANVYNAFIIHLVLKDAQKNKGLLTKSITEIPCEKLSDKIWNCPAGRVGGKTLTLEEVLSEASKLQDPRIHAAVNCASLSCPNLRAEAYKTESIDMQLNDQVTSWLSNPTKGALVREDGSAASVTLSKIFEFHSEDFPDVQSFLKEHLGLGGETVTVDGYFPYNWALNSVPAPKKDVPSKNAGCKKHKQS